VQPLHQSHVHWQAPRRSNGRFVSHRSPSAATHEFLTTPPPRQLIARRHSRLAFTARQAAGALSSYRQPTLVYNSDGTITETDLGPQFERPPGQLLLTMAGRRAEPARACAAPRASAF